MKPRLLYQFGDFVLSPATHELSRAGEPVNVPNRVFDCLVYLIERRERAVGRDELGAAVWGRVDVSEAQITQTILRARRLLGDGAGDEGHIRTIPRFGYHWSAVVGETLLDMASEAAVSAPGMASSADQPEPPPRAKPAPRKHHTRLRSLAVWVALGISAAVLGAWVYTRHSSDPESSTIASSQDPSPNRSVHGILVLPVDIDASADYAWVRLGAMDVIADRLRSAGLTVVSSEATISLLATRQSQGQSSPPLESLTRDTGANRVITSQARAHEKGWRVQLTSTTAAGQAVSTLADSADILTATRIAVDSLLRQLQMNAAGPELRDPELLEWLQRGRAAMLGGDLVETQRILDAVPLRFRSEPDLRFLAATVSYRAGQLDDAARRFDALLRNDGIAEDPPMRSQLRFSLGAIAMMRDQFSAAEATFESAMESLDPQRYPLEYGQAMGGRGGARFSLGKTRLGMDDLGEARMWLEQAGDPLALARMNLAFGEAQAQSGNPQAAIEVLTAAVTQLEPFGAINERLHGYSAITNVALDMLDMARAETSNAAASNLVAKVADPWNQFETLFDRTQLFLLQGQLTDADEILQQIDALDPSQLPRFDGRRDWLTAQRHFLRAAYPDAMAAASRAIISLAPVDTETAANAALIRLRAQIAMGKTGEAGEDLQNVHPLLRRTAYARPPLALRLAQAELAIALGKTQDAEQEYAAARSEMGDAILPAQQIELLASQLPFLLAQGHLDRARARVGRLPPSADQLYDGAVLKLRLHHATGNLDSWKLALEKARALAGQRTIPIDLLVAPQTNQAKLKR